MSDRYATFDCYGTLIDWNGGLRAALGSDDLLARYHEVEPEVEREQPGLPYREVLTETSRRIGAPDPEAPARTLPQWQPFPEVRDALEEARGRGWRLVILSNTDRDFIEASMALIGVEFERAIVASEVGSYKPADGHWRTFDRAFGRPPDVHVAASLFHDIAPCAELGIPSVWINRLGESSDLPRLGELSDLTGLPALLRG